MELSQPVLLCTIPTNVMAHEVAQWLADEGVACQVIEGSDPLGGPENARIMVSIEDHPRGVQLLQSIQRSAPPPAQAVEVPLRAEMIDVKCERCGHEMRFPPIRQGEVDNCPNCFAFIDIGSDVDYDDWNVVEAEGNEPPLSNDE